jgi:tetratricopeptide (TPR) repeat protein
MNLAVVHLKLGAYETARDFYGEAYAVFAANKNAECELYTLYNLADLDRERGEYEIAAEMYDVAIALAARLGQAEVEIGALGGQGLSLLRLGRVGAALPLLERASERMSGRRNAGAWFQGRETVEALAAGIAALEGRTADAIARVDAACALAEPNDLFSAAWLAAESAVLIGTPALAEGSSLRARLERYAQQVASLRCVELSRRYAALLG